jgi:hypothetical protein
MSSAIRPASDPLGGLEPFVVDVVECDLGVRELGEGEDVSEQVLGELDAPGADEGNPGAHGGDILRQPCADSIPVAKKRERRDSNPHFPAVKVRPPRPSVPASRSKRPKEKP